MDILIPGHYFCDVIFRGFPHFPALGTEVYTEDLTVVPGGALNTVVGLQRLGVHVGWIGTLGNDFFSNFVHQALAQEGLDFSMVEFSGASFQRVTVSLSYPEDRAFVTFIDPPTDLITRIEQALDSIPFRILYVPELKLDARMPALIDACHARGITVFMECQHLDAAIDEPLVQAILGKVDAFLPNAIEAQRLTNTLTLEGAVAQLRQWVDFLVVKDGEHGAHLWRGDTYLHAPTFPVDTIVDTTGAGDVFNAGFLAAYHAGKPLAECLRWGNAAGALSLRGAGGVPTAPTLTELTQKLAGKG